MKSIRNIAFSAFLTFAAFSAVTLASCSKDECKNVECGTGTCNEDDGSCTCPTGYEGANCETLSRTKFLGTYKGAETCTTGADDYSIVLAANSNELQITLTNLYNDNYTATCTMTASDKFSFSGNQSGATFTGTGVLAGNQLTVDYTIQDALINNTCKFIGSK